MRPKYIETIAALLTSLLSACIQTPPRESSSSAGAPAEINGPNQNQNLGGGPGYVADAGCAKNDSPFVTSFPDSGPCDDSPVLRIGAGVDTHGRYAVSCDSQAPEMPGCQGIPNDLWGRCVLRRCESTESYPEGCAVQLPHENPYYPGSPQACVCMRVSPDMPLNWTCGL